ncbi:hypothetical protein ElyMa_002227400 [Elysia marginata]|uniref:THAP-type domain-containing protein n=1 Tax=Elysia marginata TaxID=1093978 RepID=A0AAV4FWA1_9GAST|nr:hypothetical protein ElyMa_002227400 [Elysia marginata]
MPLKRCSWGLCNSDSWYNDQPHMKNVKFHRFPNPKTQKTRCMHWILMCNRPHYQLNINKVTRYHYVCSKTDLLKGVKFPWKEQAYHKHQERECVCQWILNCWKKTIKISLIQLLQVQVPPAQLHQKLIQKLKLAKISVILIQSP